MAATEAYDGKFGNICRLCLKQEGLLLPIFNDDESEDNCVLANKITSIAVIQVQPEDGLPTLVCETCKQLVEKFYDFRVLIEVSDRTLRSYLQTWQEQVDEMDGKGEVPETSNIQEIHIRSSNSSENDNNSFIPVKTIFVPVDGRVEIWNVSDANETILEDSSEEIIEDVRKLENIREWTKYECKQCTEAFDSSADLSEHLLLHEEEEESLKLDDINCQLCFQPFDSLEELKNHVAEHFLNIDNNKRNKPLITNSEVDEELLIDKIDEKQIDDVKSLEIVDKLTYFCFDCKRIFSSKESYSLHMKLHFSMKKPFKCKYCHKGFSRLTSKKHHELTNHNKISDKKFICNECGKTFFKRSELRYHKGTHTDSKPICNVCNKTFQNIQSYKIHMKRHTLGSRFQCNTCGKSYYTNSELSRHVQKHSGKREHPCQLCDMSFLSKPELNRHLKYHNGEKKFQCNICSKSYYESGHLKVHERVHTGEKPFVCSVCGKGFISRSKLLRHEKIHAKERI